MVINVMIVLLGVRCEHSLRYPCVGTDYSNCYMSKVARARQIRGLARRFRRPIESVLAQRQQSVCFAGVQEPERARPPPLRIESYGVVAATAGEEAALGCRVFPSESATVGQCAFLSRGTIAPAWVGGERVTQASLALSARKMSVTFSAERSRRKQEMKPTRSDHRGQNAVTSAVTLAR